MLRFVAGVVSSLLLVAAGFFIWKGQAESEPLVPTAPRADYISTQPGLVMPPAATEKSKEEKRFARADKDDDGRITRAELMAPRLKAFAKLDKNGDGRLSFDEWAVKTVDKFAGADADKSAWLSPAEYETTRPKPAKPKKCAC
ncbi:MAG: histidine kinase [Sphingosinicella sp.]|nr:histidine kinase [Sphingosinicella sp.]